MAGMKNEVMESYERVLGDLEQCLIRNSLLDYENAMFRLNIECLARRYKSQPILADFKDLFSHYIDFDKLNL